MKREKKVMADGICVILCDRDIIDHTYSSKNKKYVLLSSYYVRPTKKEAAKTIAKKECHQPTSCIHFFYTI